MFTDDAPEPPNFPPPAMPDEADFPAAEPDYFLSPPKPREPEIDASAPTELSDRKKESFSAALQQRAPLQKAFTARLGAADFDIERALVEIATAFRFLPPGNYIHETWTESRTWPATCAATMLLYGSCAPYQRRTDVPTEVWQAAERAVEQTKAHGHLLFDRRRAAFVFGITAQLRYDLRLWQFGATDMSDEQLAQDARDRDNAKRRADYAENAPARRAAAAAKRAEKAASKAVEDVAAEKQHAQGEAHRESSRECETRKRRANGAKPHAESIERAKPWLDEGIGRSTWYSRKNKAQNSQAWTDSLTESAAISRNQSKSQSNALETFDIYYEVQVVAPAINLNHSGDDHALSRIVRSLPDSSSADAKAAAMRTKQIGLATTIRTDATLFQPIGRKNWCRRGSHLIARKPERHGVTSSAGFSSRLCARSAMKTPGGRRIPMMVDWNQRHDSESGDVWRRNRHFRSRRRLDWIGDAAAFAYRKAIGRIGYNGRCEVIHKRTDGARQFGSDPQARGWRMT